MRGSEVRPSTGKRPRTALSLAARIVLASLPLSWSGAALAQESADPRPDATSPAVDGARAPRSTGTRADATEIVPVPDTGITLGWGWNSYDDIPLPTICIEFVEGAEPAQTQTVSLREVSDNYEIMKHIGVTAEASVSAIGIEANAKASFAKDAKLSGSASHFLLDASVQDGVRYAAPVPGRGAQPLEGVEPITTRGGTTGSIRLTTAAQKLVKENVREFQRACGDAFVSAVFSGANLTALVTINTSSHAEQERLSAQASGSGWGVTVSGSTETESGETHDEHEREVSVLLTGGRNEPIPTTPEEVVETVRRLAVVANDAPKDFTMGITSYEVLANWPGGILSGEESEFEQLAGRWGAFSALYDEIQQMLDRPREYHFGPSGGTGVMECILKDQGGTIPGTPLGAAETSRLETLQDEVLVIVRELARDARACAGDGRTCDFDHERYPDPYRYRVRLPLPNCAFAVDAPRHLDTFEKQVLAYHVVDRVKRRCDLDPTNLGCRTNAEIDALWESVERETTPLSVERFDWIEKSLVVSEAR